MLGLIISMEDGEVQSPEQMRALVEAIDEVQLHCQGRLDLYEWVNRTLRQRDYGLLRALAFAPRAGAPVSSDDQPASGY